MAHFSSREIARVWACEHAKDGKSSSAMSFNGPRFFSYSTIIAEIVRGPKGTIYFVSKEKYSATTGRHISRVWNAIPSWAETIEVPGVNRGIMEGLGDPKRIIGGLRYFLYNKLDELKTAKRQPKRLRILGEADLIFTKMKRVAEFYELSINMPDLVESGAEYAKWVASVERLTGEAPELMTLVVA